MPTAESLATLLLGRIVDGQGYLVRSGDETRGPLTRFAEQVLVAVLAPEHDAEAARAAGRALVEAHLVDPAALESAQAAVGEACAPAADSPGRVLRLSAVVGAVGRGYAQALRVRALGEHEEITRAALIARRRADEARWSSEARFRVLFEHSPVAIAMMNPQGASIEANRAAAELVASSVEGIRETTLAHWLPPDEHPVFWADLARLTAGEVESIEVEHAVLRPDGSQVWLESVVSAVRDEDGGVRYLVSITKDVTERMELQRRLRHQAGHDPLTGLPNRSLFFERLQSAIDDAEQDGARPGVCYLDLDGFKVVNDTLGHETGDRLLQALAERLRDNLEPAGHLVARMGGDEFVVLVERSPDREMLEEVAALALETVRHSVRIGEHDIAISASVGVVRHDTGGPAELMKAADTTLYSAKHDGRGRYAVFDRERHQADVLNFELSAQMPEALRKDHFHVLYQPIVRLSDETMVGVEALVRWLRPDGELIGPDRFIPLAEETGLVVPLGRRVLEESCRQARRWLDADPSNPLVISVNVAARQVTENDLVADVVRVLGEHGLPPELLQLELTERDLMDTQDKPASVLREIADLGVRIAIDDFGTGYSNLAYLRQLPVHHLKLAGSFVGGAGDRDDVILRALVKLARSLDLEVTAEAVETREQAVRLRRYGSANAQGWYYAPAVPAERIPGLVRYPFVR
ncbi:putative bifunctional diguanylate cyclase/phosphodiesterase [Pseudonocardia endophytica]|uniref:putative bifunctional diguanylate cyclase/phosphodiesterase n=1 Tax=Pseudonocardia endophytica TaxID=401976 RepID=UPI0010479B17|nr:EAL domain-containing protein [Pseudonocardia endophytica]